MNFEKSFENFVQILSEEAITPEISPSAIADLAKEYSLRSIVLIISQRCSESNEISSYARSLLLKS